MDILKVKVKKMSIASLIFSILFIIAGLFLLLRPETAINIICYILGVILLISGVVYIIQFFSDKSSDSYLSISFIFGAFLFIFGVIILIRPDIIASIIPLLVGVWMLINGVTKLSYALTINKVNRTTLSIVGSIIIIIIGILLIFNPFEGAKNLVRIIGISFIFYSVIDLVESILITLSIKKTDDNVGKIVDATYKDKEE